LHFLVFDRAPQPFDENIVHETTASVHRNRDACSLEPTGEGGAGELRAPIAVEYFRRAVPRHRFSERRAAKARIRRVRPAARWTRDARTRQIQQLTWPANRQILTRPLDHRPALGDTHRPGLLAKKSLSTVNWPILV